MWRKKRKENSLYETKQVLIFVCVHRYNWYVSFRENYRSFIAFRFIERNYTKGDTKNWNCLREGVPPVVQASPTRWVFQEPICISVSCKRLPSASASFFWRAFQCICPFHDGWFTSTPAHIVLGVQQFWPKMTWPQCPVLPLHTILPWATSFVSLGEKSPQKEPFCWCGRGETKNRSTRTHQNWWVQNLFWAVENSLNRCIASKGEYCESDWSLNI